MNTRLEHAAALRKFYHENGVARTPAARLRFWKNQHKGGFSIPHWDKFNTAQRVKCFEAVWLVEHYQQDFKLC